MLFKIWINLDQVKTKIKWIHQTFLQINLLQKFTKKSILMFLKQPNKFIIGAEL